VSVRLKLTLSYAAFLMLAGALLLAAVWVFLLRYVPDRALVVSADPGTGVFPVRSNLLHVFAPRAAAVLAFLLVFGVAGGWILAGRVLSPLTRLTDAARLASTGSLSHRVRLPGRQDEFRELADAFDTMLARLEAHVAEQRRFAANASHELRTPLAVSQALLEVARADPEHDAGETMDRLRSVNARAIALTEALLLLGRAEQRSFTRERVDLSLMAEEAAETLLPLAERYGVTVGTGGDITPATGSQALLLQLTVNLVQNAIVHNLPERGAVWVRTGVRTGVRGGGAFLTVENTGERIGAELAATFTEPFQRGGGRARDDHAGVGLGLAIVRTITHAHDGTLTVTPRPAGGLRVTVELPATEPAARPGRFGNSAKTGSSGNSGNHAKTGKARGKAASAAP
jgi:two-component system sensor histidine kinase VanS